MTGYIAWGNGEPCPICHAPFERADYKHLLAHPEVMAKLFPTEGGERAAPTLEQRIATLEQENAILRRPVGLTAEKRLDTAIAGMMREPDDEDESGLTQEQAAMVKRHLIQYFNAAYHDGMRAFLAGAPREPEPPAQPTPEPDYQCTHMAPASRCLRTKGHSVPHDMAPLPASPTPAPEPYPTRHACHDPWCERD